MSTSFRDYIKNVDEELRSTQADSDDNKSVTPHKKMVTDRHRPAINMSDLAAMSEFANIFIINANAEEVVIKFGVHQNWDRPDEISDIKLHSRLVLNPYFAKRLSIMLTRFIREYERRYVEVNIEPLEAVRQQAARATKH